MEHQHPSSLQLDTLNDCDPSSMPVDQARELIQQYLTPLAQQEAVSLHLALQRTLASDVLSPMNVPPHDYSAMDGYAMRHADLAHGSTRLKIIGSSYAGHPFNGTLSANECVRIMTGALIPQGGDSVVMQEQVKVDGETITISSSPHLGQNIRRAGEDMQQGAIVLQRGQVIRPAEMGLLASLGFQRNHGLSQAARRAVFDWR